MRLLLDTQLLLWTASNHRRLSKLARSLIEAPENQLHFSAASVWEIAIKNALGRSDFQVNPRILRRRLVDSGYVEVAVTSEHAVEVDVLPHRHKDPFDRILLAQATIEKVTLLTSDAVLAAYPGPVRLV